MAHNHDHPCPPSYNRAFAVGVSLNVAFVALEAAGGFWSHSMALLADAGHNLGDVLGLLLSGAAAYLCTLGPNERRTYVLPRASALGPLPHAGGLHVATAGDAR